MTTYDYINTLRTADRPNLAKKSGNKSVVETMTDKDFSVKPSLAGRKARGGRPVPRTTIVPRSCKLKIPTQKIAGIYEELKSLQLSRHKHAIAVLLRVFLELSVDEYLTKTAGLKLTYTNPKNGHVGDKNLKTKVQEAIADLVSKGSTPKDFLGVTKGLNDANHPFSIDTLHAYIHNRCFTPVDTQLVAAWDNAQPFFEKLWP